MNQRKEQRSMDCIIRKATSTDATAISLVVAAALRESNAQDYSPEIIEQVQQNFSPAAILNFLGQREVYVASSDGEVVATASLDGNVVRTVFVAPACQGRGIGHQLMATIESGAVRSGVERLRVPSSITAQGFYSSLGFEKVRDEFHGAERTIIMEKTLGR
jgi:N-acetylglutamate synthase-like GNAT family acetyltransferase